MKTQSLRFGWLLVIVLGAALLGWVTAFLTAEYGWGAPVLGLGGVVTCAVVVLALLVLGIRVLKDRKRPVAARMNPVVSAQTLVLAQAGAYAGSGFLGWHLGVLSHRLPVAGWGSASVTEATVMVVASIVLLVTGCFVEQWCKVPPDDDADGGQGTGSSRTDGPEEESNGAAA